MNEGLERNSHAKSAKSRPANTFDSVRLAINMSPVCLPMAFLNVASVGHAVQGKLTRLFDNLVGLLPLVAISLALSAFIVVALIPRRTVYLLLFVLTLTAGIYVVNPHLMTYSYHGMIHLGYVYATERLPWPPEDPYLSGTPLCYPWVYHALVAKISSTLDVAPSWVFAGCNLAALAVSIVAVAAISRLLKGDKITANCAIVLAILAPTFLGTAAQMVFGPLIPAEIDPALVNALWFGYGLPPWEKYANVTPMPPAMALGLICFYELLKTILSQNYMYIHALSMMVCLVLVGYIYPFIFLSCCIMALTCAAVAAGAGAWRKAVALFAGLLLGNLVVVPYLLALTRARTSGHGIWLARDPCLYLAHFLHVAVILLPVWLLIALGRRSLFERLRERSLAHWAALLSGLALLLTFIVLDIPSADVGPAYKFRVMAVFCLAPLAATGLKRIRDWNRTAMVFVLALQLLPLCFELYRRTPQVWGSVAEPYYWQGSVLRHGARGQDQLYEWIRVHTLTTAIVIDNMPYAPVFAQRSLFVARQLQSNAEPWRKRRDGWLFHPIQWLEQVNGHPSEEVRRRNEFVDALYAGASAPSATNLLRRLHEITADRPVYVVARYARQKAVLEGRPFLRKVAEASNWTVYALEVGD